jgi:dTDP-6-deoxy-L-talose 4-dehydrogenase [NAD(P)+]
VAVASTPLTGLSARLLHLDLLAVPAAELAALLAAERAGVVVNATGGVWGVSEADLVRLNFTLVNHVLDAVRAMPWRTRLVHLGSMHEYGPVPPDRSIDETTPVRPASEYGRTKLLGSQAVLAASHAGQVDGVVLRISNAIGPGTPPASLLGQVSEQLVAAAGTGGPARLRLAPLRARRDFVDVGDIAEAVRSATAAAVAGQVINIGSGRAVSVRVLVDLLVAASGIPAQVVEVERAGADREPVRGAGVAWQRVDIRTAERLLGWAPRRRLEDSVRDLWRSVAGLTMRTAPSSF